MGNRDTVLVLWNFSLQAPWIMPFRFVPLLINFFIHIQPSIFKFMLHLTILDIGYGATFFLLIHYNSLYIVMVGQSLIFHFLLTSNLFHLLALCLVSTLFLILHDCGDLLFTESKLVAF